MSFLAFRRRNTAKLGVLTLIVAAMLTAGCGKSAGTDGAAEAAGSSAPTASDSNTTYTVKHAMGETTIKGTPKRIVILTNEGTEALLALGIKPVGAVDSYVGSPWYDHIKADMQGVQNLGQESQPNLELIASLKPDLIIGNKMRQEKVYQQLSDIAPTVFSTDLRGEWMNNFKLYAEAVNRKGEGDKVLADFNARIDDFKKKAGDKLNKKVSVVRFMPGKVRIYYKNTFSGIIFQSLGIARPKAQDIDDFAADVSKERIPEMDGDMLLYFTYETGDGKANATEQEWLNDPLWKNLSVVKAGNVHKVSDTIWNTAGGVRAANLMLDELYTLYGLTK